MDCELYVMCRIIRNTCNFCARSITNSNTGTMATSVRNFSSHDRGIVVGIAKGAFAVSTGFVAQLYIGMYKPDALHFLLFLAFFSPCVIILCVPFLRLVPFDEHEKASSSSCGLITTSILILFNGSWLVLVVLLQQMSESKQIKLMSLCTCIVFMSMILCVSPCIRCCKTSANRRRGRRAIELTKNSILKVMRRRKSQKYERVSLGTASMPSSSIQHDVEKAIQKVKRRTIRVRSMSRSMSTESALRDVVQSKSLLEVLVLKDFYILAVAFLVGSGSGLMYINNLTQIVQSQMESSNMTDSQYLKTKNTLIVLFGASNLYGRVVIGAVSDRLGGKTIRAGLLSACLTLMGISHFILSASENDVDSLYPSTLLVGFFFGCVFSLCASLVADLFGYVSLASYFFPSIILTLLSPIKYADPSILRVITVPRTLHLHWEVSSSVPYLPVRFTTAMRLLMEMGRRLVTVLSALKHLLF